MSVTVHLGGAHVYGWRSTRWPRLALPPRWPSSLPLTSSVDAAAAVDAKNAPTAAWKTHRTRFPQRPPTLLVHIPNGTRPRRRGTDVRNPVNAGTRRTADYSRRETGARPNVVSAALQHAQRTHVADSRYRDLAATVL